MSLFSVSSYEITIQAAIEYFSKKLDEENQSYYVNKMNDLNEKMNDQNEKINDLNDRISELKDMIKLILNKYDQPTTIM